MLGTAYDVGSGSGIDFTEEDLRNNRSNLWINPFQ
jgi:hypothetical protein